MAAFALKAGEWFRRGRLLIVSPDSLGTACPLSGRNSTYRPVQISGAGSVVESDESFVIGYAAPESSTGGAPRCGNLNIAALLSGVVCDIRVT